MTVGDLNEVAEYKATFATKSEKLAIFDFYNISRFKPDLDFSHKTWNNIPDVIQCNNDDMLKHYLWPEEQHIKFIIIFINYFSIDRLDYSISVENLDEISKNHFYSMEKPIEKMEALGRLDLNALDKPKLHFLSKSWIRGLFYLYLFDIITGSFIRKADSFNFLLMMKSGR